MSSYSNEETDPMDAPMPGRTTSPKKYINRKSVADEASVTQQYIMGNVKELTVLWDEVDMSEKDRVQRLHKVYSHIRELTDNMYASEVQMVQSVKTTISDGLQTIKDLRRELCMDEWTSDHKYPSIALMKDVENEQQHLSKLFETRKDEQDRIIERLEVLCDRLGKSQVEHLPEPTKKLVSRSELRRCSDLVATFEKELKERVIKALSWQADLRVWYRNLKPVYGDNTEAALQVFLNEDIEDDNFLLTTSIIERLETFWNEYYAMHNTWKSNMDLEWTTHYAELKDLWDQCLYGVEERIFPSQFDPARHSQDDIDAMADEVRKLQQIVARREPIYKALSLWKEAWQQKLHLEELKKDPAYYQSRERGRNISKDAQQERYLHDVKLPQLKKAVASAYATYLESRPEDRVLIEGYLPVQYIEWLENEYNLSKERERTAKLVQKKTITGVFNTPQTGKRINNLPVSKSSNVPPKKKKLAEPQISIITPTRTPSVHGPKTSSPKEFGTPITPSSTPRRANTPSSRRFP